MLSSSTRRTNRSTGLCTVRRAVVLLLKEKAEVVEQTERQLHSANTTLDACPAVIRLVTYVKVPRDSQRRKITRRAVFARDDWTCQYCGSRTQLTVIDPCRAPLEGRRLELGQHRRCLCTVQPAQGRLAASAGRDDPGALTAHAKPRRLHPGRESHDSGHLEAVPVAVTAADGSIAAWSPPIRCGRRPRGPLGDPDRRRETAPGRSRVRARF